MKITIKQVPTPFINSFMMFAKPDLCLLRETKTVTIRASNETKTRISTTISFGDYSVRINHSHKDFKTFESREYSHFNGEYSNSNYFVKSKKQDLDCYKQYITDIVKNIIINNFKVTDIDELTILLICNQFEN